MRRLSAEELRLFYQSKYKDYLEPTGWQTIKWEFGDKTYKVRPVSLVDLINFLEILEKAGIDKVEKTNDKNKKNSAKEFHNIEKKLKEIGKELKDKVSYYKANRLDYIVKVKGFRPFKTRNIKDVLNLYNFLLDLQRKNKFPEPKYEEETLVFDDVKVLLSGIKNNIKIAEKYFKDFRENEKKEIIEILQRLKDCLEHGDEMLKILLKSKIRKKKNN